MSKRVIAILLALGLFIVGSTLSFFTNVLSTDFASSMKGLDEEGLASSTVDGSDATNQIARIEIDGTNMDTGTP